MALFKSSAELIDGITHPEAAKKMAEKAATEITTEKGATEKATAEKGAAEKARAEKAPFTPPQSSTWAADKAAGRESGLMKANLKAAAEKA
jgi:hypothetical protein